jgi:hypothetical protein
MSEDAGRAPQENAEKDRAYWVTGGEPMQNQTGRGQ